MCPRSHETVFAVIALAAASRAAAQMPPSLGPTCRDAGIYTSAVKTVAEIPEGAHGRFVVLDGAPLRVARLDLRGGVVTPPGVVTVGSDLSCQGSLTPLDGGYVLSNASSQWGGTATLRAMRVDPDGKVLVPCRDVLSTLRGGKVSFSFASRGAVAVTTWVEPGMAPDTHAVFAAPIDPVTLTPRTPSTTWLRHDDVPGRVSFPRDPWESFSATTGKSLAVSWYRGGGRLEMEILETDGTPRTSPFLADGLRDGGWIEAFYDPAIRLLATTTAYGVLRTGYDVSDPNTSATRPAAGLFVFDELGAQTGSIGMMCPSPLPLAGQAFRDGFYGSIWEWKGFPEIADSDFRLQRTLDFGRFDWVTTFTGTTAYGQVLSLTKANDVHVLDCSEQLAGPFHFVKDRQTTGVRLECSTPLLGIPLLVSTGNRRDRSDLTPLGDFTACPIVAGGPTDPPGLTLVHVGP